MLVSQGVPSDDARRRPIAGPVQGCRSWSLANPASQIGGERDFGITLISLESAGRRHDRSPIRRDDDLDSRFTANDNARCSSTTSLSNAIERHSFLPNSPDLAYLL
jgi:hypothetical protein